MTPRTPTEMIRAYRAGALGFDALVRQLAEYHWKSGRPVATGSPYEGTDFDPTVQMGTFDEVRDARDKGWFTSEEFLAINEAVWKARTRRHPPSS